MATIKILDGDGVERYMSVTGAGTVGDPFVGVHSISGVATSAKQDLLLTELQAKADLNETQPVSASTLPLPTGAATSAKQDLLLTELQAKADLSETQPVSLVTLPSGTNVIGATKFVDENGTAYGVKQINGKPRVSAQSYLYDIAEGSVLNHNAMLKFGTRSSVAANTQSNIWEGTNPLYTRLTSPQQLKVSSDSAQDGVGGTGIRTLTLVGLDSNWDDVSETITMDGTTVVTTSTSFIRIFRAYGVISGTTHSNVGTITVTNNAGTVQQLVILPNDGQTLMTLWTVPANKVAYITQATFSTSSNKGARVALFTRLNDGINLYSWQIKYRAYTFSGNDVFPFTIPIKIPAKTDVEIRVLTPSSAGITSCGATFDAWYESV